MRWLYSAVVFLRVPSLAAELQFQRVCTIDSRPIPRQMTRLTENHSHFFYSEYDGPLPVEISRELTECFHAPSNRHW
jgi:hypothetical protein